MAFYSVLDQSPVARAQRETPDPPDFFIDLNLDQVIDAITVAYAEYNLKPFFYSCLTDAETIKYRQEIMRDLECDCVLRPVRSFAQEMRVARHRLAGAAKLSYRHLKERSFLDAVQVYSTAVRRLVHDLSRANLHSRGLIAFRGFLQDYSESQYFASLLTEAQPILAALAALEYSLVIKGLRVEVRGREDEAEYTTAIEETFARFRHGAVKDYRVDFRDFPQINHVQEAILEQLARLRPQTFSALDRYLSKHEAFLDKTIADFDREIQFYVAYLDFIAKLKRSGLKFCYPQVSSEDKQVCSYEGFDLALANKNVQVGLPVVCNDFRLEDGERIFVVTGPNQGGKTTFARTFGQLSYLASIGCPVPGRGARLFLFDKLFTHFERREDIKDLRGHLEDDLIRIHSVLEQATSNSIIILNETFNSTTLKDILFLGANVMSKIIDLDALCVFVTFVDEFASRDPKVVSMVSTVLPEDPEVRTFVIERRPASGLAHAVSIARKHGLSYERLKGRIRP